MAWRDDEREHRGLFSTVEHGEQRDGQGVLNIDADGMGRGGIWHGGPQQPLRAHETHLDNHCTHKLQRSTARASISYSKRTPIAATAPSSALFHVPGSCWRPLSMLAGSLARIGRA